jgi:hypothetical protein
MVTLLAFFSMTVISFFLWIWGLFVFWLVLRLFDFTIDLMAMIEALSTAVAAAAVLGAGFIAYRELSEIANSRHLEIADRLFNELNSSENIEARRRIYQNLPADPEEGLKKISAEDRDAVKKVLNSLDRVAFLTQSGWIPDGVIMPWMHPMIAKSWEKLGPYVEYERKHRNEPYYYKYAGDLAVRCKNWREKHLLENDINWVDNAL